MTEIPEHLLKRSRERRAAIGGGEAGAAEPSAPADTGGTAATAAEAPAAASAAVEPAAPAAPPAQAEPEPPKPVSAPVAAAQRRRRIPYWAMPVLAALPLWAYMYQGTLEPPPEDETDPYVLGEELYSSCAACHGGGGEGRSGVPGLEEVLATWPDFRDHMMWVKLGSTGWPGDTYGADDKPKAGGMPEHPVLSDEDLARVVLYERTEFAGEEPADQVDLLAVANGEMTFAEAGLGPVSEAAGVEPPAG
jgi:mono/diheme cytochrome c family protein